MRFTRKHAEGIAQLAPRDERSRPCPPEDVRLRAAGPRPSGFRAGFVGVVQVQACALVDRAVQKVEPVARRGVEIGHPERVGWRCDRLARAMSAGDDGERSSPERPRLRAAIEPRPPQASTSRAPVTRGGDLAPVEPSTAGTSKPGKHHVAHAASPWTGTPAANEIGDVRGRSCARRPRAAPPAAAPSSAAPPTKEVGQAVEDDRRGASRQAFEEADRVPVRIVSDRSRRTTPKGILMGSDTTVPARPHARAPRWPQARSEAARWIVGPLASPPQACQGIESGRSQPAIGHVGEGDHRVRPVDRFARDRGPAPQSRRPRALEIGDRNFKPDARYWLSMSCSSSLVVGQCDHR